MDKPKYMDTGMPGEGLPSPAISRGANNCFQTIRLLCIEAEKCSQPMQLNV